MGLKKRQRTVITDIGIVLDNLAHEEKLRIHAQYEDKKFLELVGRGVIKRGVGAE